MHVAARARARRRLPFWSFHPPLPHQVGTNRGICGGSGGSGQFSTPFTASHSDGGRLPCFMPWHRGCNLMGAMRLSISLLLVPALICALAGQGLAQESKPAEEKIWYGGQTLLVDALSCTTFVVGGVTGSGPIALLGVSSYILAPGGVHAFHHHGGRAALSVLMRLSFPLVGGLIGLLSANCRPRPGDGEWAGLECAAPYGAAGFGIGMAASMVVDASIAWDPTPLVLPAWPPPPEPPRQHGLIGFTSASLVPTPSGPRLVIGGRF